MSHNLGLNLEKTAIKEIWSKVSKPIVVIIVK